MLKCPNIFRRNKVYKLYEQDTDDVPVLERNMLVYFNIYTWLKWHIRK